jgi:hypothetical protein
MPMPKRAQRGSETKQVSFRMPLDIYNHLSAIAEARGVDLSAVLNWICVEHLPQLLQKEAMRKTALVNAAVAVANLPHTLASEAETGEALSIVRELLKKLQDEYASLSKRALDEDHRQAG